MSDEANTASGSKAMRFRRADAPRLEPNSARRQGEIARLAFQVLGREQAIAFLNTAHAGLGGRPLDLAIVSEEGRATVAAELGRLANAGSEPAR